MENGFLLCSKYLAKYYLQTLKIISRFLQAQALCYLVLKVLQENTTAASPGTTRSSPFYFDQDYEDDDDDDDDDDGE